MTNVIINNPCHMTKMAAMGIAGKTSSQIFLSRTAEPISGERLQDHWCFGLFSGADDILYKSSCKTYSVYS